ncbi:MAG: HEAT repeat domain-containing protein [Myxococcota bacterium]
MVRETMTGPTWRWWAEVRPAERERVAFFALLLGLVTLAETLGLTAAEALFLSRVGAAELPLAFLLAAPATVIGTLAYALRVDRSRNDRLFLGLLVGGAAILVLASVAVRTAGAWIFPGILCFYFVSFAILMNHYWTFASDFFDTLAAKRLVPLLNAGGSLGGIAGGVLGVAISRTLGATALIVAWSGFLLIAALQLRVGRRALRRWGPLELEEGDDTSLSGLGGALRYSRRSPLGRWLIVSTAAMVLALFASQYIYLAVFANVYPDPDALAAFLGLYLAITNGIEIGVELWLLPVLIRRLGVGAANLAHPLLTLLSFGGLAWHPGLAAAVAARANRELAENALAAPLRTLVYNALPPRLRGRIRGLLEGIIVYTGMALAGILLWVAAPHASLRQLALLGIGLTLLYGFANLRVRREYLETIVGRLRAGRLDLRELDGEVGRVGLQRLAVVWESLRTRRGSHLTRAELDLPRIFVQRGLLATVLDAASDPDPRIRAACASALAETSEPRARVALERALADRDASVRLAAASALGESPQSRDGHRPRLTHLLEDASPEVRAAAAGVLGEAGNATLRSLASSDDPRSRVAALRHLPGELLPVALELATSPHPAVRAEALEAASRLGRPVPIPTARLEAELACRDARVRRAAVLALGTRSDAAARRALARVLGDPKRELRDLAAKTLAAAGDAALEVLQPCLSSPSAHSAEAAASALATIGSRVARSQLREELEVRVGRAWRARLALVSLDGPQARDLFLRAALEDVARRDRALAFRMLERLESASVMRTVERVLRFASARARADALEVLSNLGDREIAALLVRMIDEDSVHESSGTPRDPETVRLELASWREPWVSAALGAFADDGETRTLSQEHMERLLVLRQVDLFAHLSLDQLEAINGVLEEESFGPGDELCHEGDSGDKLFILVDGEIEFIQGRGEPGERRLGRARGVSYSGEMAILDGRPRSNTTVARTPATVLVLDGQRLRELILESPEIAFEMFRVLVGRIRRAEQRGDSLPGGAAEGAALQVPGPPEGPEVSAGVQSRSDT